MGGVRSEERLDMSEFCGRAPTEDEIRFLDEVGLDIGFDDDDKDKHQFCHICWPVQLNFGALCGSDRLWFQGAHADDGYVVDCEKCWAQLLRLQTMDPVLLHAIGTLAKTVSAETKVVALCDDFLLTLDHPEECRWYMSLEETRARLNESIAEMDAVWESTQRAPKPISTDDGWKLPEAKR